LDIAYPCDSPALVLPQRPCCPSNTGGYFRLSINISLLAGLGVMFLAISSFPYTHDHWLCSITATGAIWIPTIEFPDYFRVLACRPAGTRRKQKRKPKGPDMQSLRQNQYRKNYQTTES